MKRYKIAMKLLSPVHIGTGEDFEPLNYVIDEAKKADGTTGKYLFGFDEMKFFTALDDASKQQFSALAGSNYFALHKFIKSKKLTARNIASLRIPVDTEIFNDYNTALGEVRQFEGNGNKKFNEFRIAKTFTNPNSNKAIIPGSSIKGALLTAFAEHLCYKNPNFEKMKNNEKIDFWKKQIEPKLLKPSNDNIFRSVLLSDSLPFEMSRIVGLINVSRNKDAQGLSTRAQVITRQESSFELAFDDKYIQNPPSMAEIASACNEHYLSLFCSYLDDKSSQKYIKSDFLKLCEKYDKEPLAKNQFLIRIGQHSGARAVTVDGIREITILQGKGKPPRKSDEETTFWVTKNGKMPLGWVLCSYEELKD